MRGMGILAVVVGSVLATAAIAWNDVKAVGRPATAGAPFAVATAVAVPAAGAAGGVTRTAVNHPSFSPLQKAVAGLAAADTARVGVTVIELGGESPSTWSYNGSAEFNAASTYKLVAMMDEAQRIASGAVSASGNVCFQQSDWEDGWFDEYKPGACYTRQVLASRAGIQSDNTAGHMLVRDIGGTQALNAFAAAEGATASELFKDPNTTTADDLATLLSALASGRLGGAAAQAWLYPLLTHTRYEAGIPAGVPSGATVVHKTGDVDSTLDDAAIVQGGRNGTYVIVVMSDGASGWGLLASISAAVWSYEQSR